MLNFAAAETNLRNCGIALSHLQMLERHMFFRISAYLYDHVAFDETRFISSHRARHLPLVPPSAVS